MTPLSWIRKEAQEHDIQREGGAGPEEETGGDGVNRITRTTKVTGKGQVYFINKFLAAKPELLRRKMN